MTRQTHQVRFFILSLRIPPIIELIFLLLDVVMEQISLVVLAPGLQFNLLGGKTISEILKDWVQLYASFRVLFNWKWQHDIIRLSGFILCAQPAGLSEGFREVVIKFMALDSWGCDAFVAVFLFE